jgi:hypothetical protein
MVGGLLAQAKHEMPSEKQTKSKRAGDMALFQVVECLPSKCSTAKKKKKSKCE